MLHAFTSAALNYLPKVRLLCNTLKRFHPEIQIHFALADELTAPINLTAEPFDYVIPIDQLGIPDARRWIFKYNLTELSTAIKPFVFQYLFRRSDCDGVLYFDPDIMLFSRLDDLLDQFSQCSIALTPHLLKPAPTYSSVIDHELFSVLRNGIYNLGFAGVKNDPEGRAFADWWANRVYMFCRAEPENGMWTDQKWVDLAPIYFNWVTVLRSPRFNVASWNLPTRLLTGSQKEGFFVDGQPLGFYHFTGWDSGDHLGQVLKHSGGDKTAVMELLQGYNDQLIIQQSPISQREWSFGSFSNGQPITDLHRHLYRSRLDLQNAFSDPFNSDAEFCYNTWFQNNAPNEHPDEFLNGCKRSWTFDVKP